MGDDTARRLEKLIFQNRSQIEAMDRRLKAIEATQSHHSAATSGQARSQVVVRPKALLCRLHATLEDERRKALLKDT
jgi:hypothetical protein